MYVFKAKKYIKFLKYVIFNEFWLILYKAGSGSLKWNGSGSATLMYRKVLHEVLYKMSPYKKGCSIILSRPVKVPVDGRGVQGKRSQMTLQCFKCVTVCPRNSDPFYIVTYYIKGVTTSWTHSNIRVLAANWYIRLTCKVSSYYTLFIISCYSISRLVISWLDYIRYTTK